jgi:hypothetical protein
MGASLDDKGTVYAVTGIEFFIEQHLSALQHPQLVRARQDSQGGSAF